MQLFQPLANTEISKDIRFQILCGIGNGVAVFFPSILCFIQFSPYGAKLSGSPYIFFGIAFRMAYLFLQLLGCTLQFVKRGGFQLVVDKVAYIYHFGFGLVGSLLDFTEGSIYFLQSFGIAYGSICFQLHQSLVGFLQLLQRSAERTFLKLSAYVHRFIDGHKPGFGLFQHSIELINGLLGFLDSFRIRSFQVLLVLLKQLDSLLCFGYRAVKSTSTHFTYYVNGL